MADTATTVYLVKELNGHGKSSHIYREHSVGNEAVVPANKLPFLEDGRRYSRGRHEPHWPHGHPLGISHLKEKVYV